MPITMAATTTKKCYLLKIQHDVEIENFAGTLAEYHAQYKSVDMEMIDGIHLRVEIVDDAKQYYAGYLHDSCRLVPSETYDDEAEEIRYQRKHGCMADTGGYEEQLSLEVHQLENRRIDDVEPKLQSNQQSGKSKKQESLLDFLNQSMLFPLFWQLVL